MNEIDRGDVIAIPAPYDTGLIQVDAPPIDATCYNTITTTNTGSWITGTMPMPVTAIRRGVVPPLLSTSDFMFKDQQGPCMNYLHGLKGKRVCWCEDCNTTLSVARLKDYSFDGDCIHVGFVDAVNVGFNPSSETEFLNIYPNVIERCFLCSLDVLTTDLILFKSLRDSHFPRNLILLVNDLNTKLQKKLSILCNNTFHVD